MTDGKRCGKKCNGSTTKNAIVYFPAGKYLVSTVIALPFGTQVIGDVSGTPPGLVLLIPLRGMANEINLHRQTTGQLSSPPRTLSASASCRRTSTQAAAWVPTASTNSTM